MTGRGGGGCISPFHRIIQLQRDGQRKGGGGRTFPLDHGFHFDYRLNMNECLK